MKVYERRGKKKSPSSVLTINPDLPETIIEEILSCLPVESLLRFKCVSKHWNSTTLDPNFIYLHSENSRYLVIYNKSHEDDEFVILDHCKGLLLEESIGDDNTRRYRIKNPQVRRIIQLPNTQKKPSLYMHLAFLPSKQVFKALSIYKDENRQDLGCEILNLGNETNTSTCSWRLLKLPTLHNAENILTKFRLIFTSEVAYCIWEVSNYSQNRIGIGIDTLDMENETYIGTITLPKGNFASKLTLVDFLQWNGKVSFGKIVNDELHVLVLDDYKTNKWTEEKWIVKMKNLKEDGEAIEIICVRDFELYYLLQHKNSLCKYNFSTRKVEIVSDYDDDEVLAIIRPSLYTLNGMQSNQ